MAKGIIAICASGPSLCCEDVSQLRDYNVPVITVNSSWMIYPECQYIFAGDDAWWSDNYRLIKSAAQKWTCSKTAAIKYGINYFHKPYEGTFNSGMMAILLAMSLRADDIILLGYDCSLENGFHWHGKHYGINNPTHQSIGRWNREFEMLASELQGRVNVVNCTLTTRLNCFQRAKLVDCLKRIRS